VLPQQHAQLSVLLTEAHQLPAMLHLQAELLKQFNRGFWDAPASARARLFSMELLS
jgi:hypothetical protein